MVKLKVKSSMLKAYESIFVCPGITEYAFPVIPLLPVSPISLHPLTTPETSDYRK